MSLQGCYSFYERKNILECPGKSTLLGKCHKLCRIGSCLEVLEVLTALEIEIRICEFRGLFGEKLLCAATSACLYKNC